MTWAIRGLIEGFYGRPWSWDERLDVLATCAAGGMTHYVYAPKDDPKHRAAWREPYNGDELDGFRRLVQGSAMTVGFGISPGLDIDVDSDADRSALAAKVNQALSVGVGMVVLALDDLPTGVDPARRGRDHAVLTTWLQEVVGDEVSLVLIPTEYVGTAPSAYLRELAGGVPTDVPIGWTGVTVVNDEITAAEANARAGSLDGRPPLIWDNFPVNDTMMADRLFLGPLRGRDPGLAAVCSGYVANAMVQPRCSKLPLASIAGYLRGDDPTDAWARAAGDLRTFAEACDGSLPLALAERLVADVQGPGWFEAVRRLAAWLIRAAACEAPGLDGEADAWLDQVHREARLGLSALRLIQAVRPGASVDEAGHGTVLRPDADAAAMEAFGLALRWPQIRRSAHTVLGSRCGFRPVVGQWPDGRWRFHPGALEEDRNATDLIVRAAFGSLADAPSPTVADGPVKVLAGSAPVELAGDDSFHVRPGSLLTVELGDYRTVVHPPAGPVARHT